jgi:hypothetical protein
LTCQNFSLVWWDTLVFNSSEGVKIDEWVVAGLSIWEVANNTYKETGKVDFAMIEQDVKIKKRRLSASLKWWQQQYKLCFRSLGATVKSFNTSLVQVDKTGFSNLMIDPVIYKFGFLHLGEEMSLTLLDYEDSPQKNEYYPLTKWMNSFRKAVSSMN